MYHFITIGRSNMEEWKDVKGYEGLYQVSNTGRIKALKKIDQRGRVRKERLMKPVINSCGRPVVHVCKNGNRKTFFVHRLIAEAFIPNPEGKSEVNHINGIKDDNRVENLEWVTRSENMLHAERMGLHSMKPSIEAHKKKVCQIADRVVIRIYDSVADASKATGIEHSNRSLAANGKRGSAGGFEWRYYDV